MKAILLPVQRAKSSPLESDLAKLTGIIRERQSALIMLLEEKRQRIWDRPQWLLKESQYQQKDSSLSRQIRGIIMNWVLMQDQIIISEHQFKFVANFWLKLKIVMKMSLQRMKILNLLSEAIFSRYEAIIDQINRAYDQNSGILHYRSIQDMIRNRNKLIHDCLSQKINALNPIIERNNSEYQIKFLKKDTQSPMRSSKLLSLGKKRQLGSDFKVLKRPLSQQHRRKKIIPSGELLRPKKIKKINYTLDNFQHRLYDVMQMKIDAAIDRKKPLQTNIQNIHNDLLDKNYNNQKAITNFILSHSGKLIRKIQPKKLLKINHESKEHAKPFPLQRKKAKDQNNIRNRGLTVGKLKKLINKIGNKCSVRPSTCLTRKKKVL